MIRHYKCLVSCIIITIVLASIMFLWRNSGQRYRGHTFVDLGLSVKWASCNVGTSSPHEIGDYYAWGIIRPQKSYTTKMYIENKHSSSDSSKHRWSGRWRIPKISEFDELISKCLWEWSELNGEVGYNVIGPNGNSIFLPAAGLRLGSDNPFVGRIGAYWLTKANTYGNNVFEFTEFLRRTCEYNTSIGCQVRLVLD